MRLEQQVVSLELAKKMKELGFEQDSLFYWAKELGSNSGYVLIPKERCCLLEENPKLYISAYTVAELGVMLPRNYTVCRKLQNKSWSVDFDSVHYGNIENSETEADARAKMLIILKENNLI